MEHSADPTPKDATQPTDAQREWQREVEQQGEDPDAPGLQQDRHQIADET